MSIRPEGVNFDPNYYIFAQPSEEIIRMQMDKYARSYKAIDEMSINLGRIATTPRRENPLKLVFKRKRK